MQPSAKKSQSQGCSRAVRDLPLKRFCLPTDGRKWRVLARQRRALLLDISEYANGDGTFERAVSGQAEPVNFSPSIERLLKHWAHGPLYRYQNDLRLLHLLDWIRPDHHHRRIYRITVYAANPYTPREEEQVPDSQKEQVRDSSEQVRDSQETRPCIELTSVSSVFELPSNTRTPLTPRSGGNGKRDPRLRKQRNEDRRLGLSGSRFNSHTSADHRARQIRNSQNLGLLPPHTYENLRAYLLAHNLTLDDPQVPAILQQLREQWASQTEE